MGDIPARNKLRLHSERHLLASDLKPAITATGFSHVMAIAILLLSNVSLYLVKTKLAIPDQSVFDVVNEIVDVHLSLHRHDF